MAQEFYSDIAINGQMAFGSKQSYTLPAQGTRMRLFTIADNTLCRVYLETSENAYHQPIILDIFYRAQTTNQKPQIVRSESYEWHAHSNDVIFTSDGAGSAGASTHVYAEKVAFSTGRILNIRKIEVFDGTVTILDGSTTDTNGGTDESVVSTFAELNLGDNDKLILGDGNDLRIYHNGSNSFIQETGAGDLRLMSSHIKLMDTSENLILGVQAGAVALTGTLDVSGVLTTAGGIAHTGDTDTLLEFTGANELKIKAGGATHLHCGSDQTTHIYSGNGVAISCDTSQNATFAGKVITTEVESATTILLDAAADITIDAGGGDIILSDDATIFGTISSSGGMQVRSRVNNADMFLRGVDDGTEFNALTLDMSDAGTAIFNHNINLPDSGQLNLGGSGDLSLLHDGTDGYITEITGDLKITNSANDKDIILSSDDGSGGVTAYITLDGSDEAVVFGKAPHIPEYINHVGDGDTAFGFADNDVFRIITGGTTRFNIGGGIELTGATTITGALSITGDGSNAVTFTESSAGIMTIAAPDDIILDAAGDIAIDAAGNDIRFRTGGTTVGAVNMASSNLTILNSVQDKDIIFQGMDGNTTLFTALTLDMSDAGKAIFNDQVRLGDSKELRFGAATDGDFAFQHDGSHNLIKSHTGDLKLINFQDDGDILFFSDDGSGGITEYMRLDGGDVKTIFSKPIQVGVDDTGHDVFFYGATSGAYLQWDESGDALELKDSTYLYLGTGNDLQLYHNATDSHIENYGGDLYITQHTNDKDLIFRCDDGSNSFTAYITLDGSVTRTIFSKHTQMVDGQAFYVGAGTDGGYYSDGANVFLEAMQGDMTIVNYTNDKDIIFQSDDGSGGVTAYLTLDGSAANIKIATDMVFADNKAAMFGTGGDAFLKHDGSNCIFINDTGNVTFTNRTDDGDIIFSSDNGSGGTAEYLRLDGGIASIVVSKDILMANDSNGGKIKLGASQDLQIYHDGSDSYIENGTGNLFIMARATDADISFQSDDGSGGDVEYFRLDGGLSCTFVSRRFVFSDSTHLQFGNQSDTQIYNDGSNFYIDNITGDQDIIFKGTDGSADITALTLDMSDAGTAIFNHDIKIADDGILKIGNSTDLFLSHDATNSHIANATGHLKITQNANDKDIIFNCDDGSGGNTAYLTIDGSANQVVLAKPLIIPDDGNIGSASDPDAISIDDSGKVGFSGDGIEVTGKSTLTAREFPIANGTDGNHTGDVVYFGSTTSMTVGKIYHYKSNGSWELVDADAVATCDGLLGVALGAASNTNGMLLRGMVTLQHDPGAVGDVLFASTTAGLATATAPSGSGDIVRVIGYCLHASNGTIWFNPDGAFVEVA